MNVALPFLLAFVTGAGHIWARMAGRRRAAFWLKPLPIVVFLILAATASPAVSSAYRWLVCLALAFSMAGDVLLAWPRDRFVAGLATFLLAHVAYSAAFVTRAGFGVALWVLLLVVLLGAAMLALLWPYVARGLKPAVALYMAVILVMLWQAVEVWLVIGDRSSALALAGASFFVVSDSTLAIDKFRRSFKLAPVAVMATYYLAQWLLTLSVAAP